MDTTGTTEASASQAALMARVARLEDELSASQRTVDVLVKRAVKDQSTTGPDRRAFLRAIGQLETTAAARQRDLAEREEYYRALFHQSPDAILALDEHGVVQSCNRTAELTFGLDLARLVGRPVTTLFSEDSGASLTGLLWSGFSGVGDAELIAPHGRQLGFSVARLSATEVLLVLRDVTQRRHLEADLERARRYAGYGRLAAKLAAEITNPLSVVLGRLELLQQRPPQRPELLLPVLSALSEHCRRIDDTVGNLRALGRPRSPRPQRVLLVDLVAGAVARSAAALRRVRLDVTIPEDVAVVVDVDHAELALRDLMLYLGEIMPSERTLSVRAAGGHPNPVTLYLLGEQASASSDVLSAMSRSTRDVTAPFDPALGLGLAIAWVLLSDNGGSLTASADQSRGLQLVVTLPGEQPQPRSAAEGTRVLVVDDDHLLCETVSWMLSGLGLSVHTTRSAEDALRVLNTKHFDRVLCDLVLPGMDGESFLAQVVKRWPAMADQVVLTTGSSRGSAPGVPLLHKPFDRTQLIDALKLV